MEEEKEVVEIKEKGADWKQIIFLVLICLAIGALIASLVIIIKYKNMLAFPLSYNMDKFNLKFCDCVDSKGLHIYANNTSYINPNGFKNPYLIS